MVKRRKKIFLCAVLILVLSGCVTVPRGPSVMVMPPPGKPFDLFQKEDAVCRQWAAQQIGLSPQETVDQNTAAGAAVGTIVGAGIGAAIGAASGHSGTGAAVGAATGLLFGASAGAESGQYYGREAQRRYDYAYQQCMYANGNVIPGMRRVRRTATPPPPPPPGSDYVPPDSSQPYYAPPPAPPPQ